MKIKGIIYILLAALIYGFTPLLCAFTYPLGNNGFSMTFFRSFFCDTDLISNNRFKEN